MTDLNIPTPGQYPWVDDLNDDLELVYESRRKFDEVVEAQQDVLAAAGEVAVDRAAVESARDQVLAVGTTTDGLVSSVLASPSSQASASARTLVDAQVRATAVERIRSRALLWHEAAGRTLMGGVEQTRGLCVRGEVATPGVANKMAAMLPFATGTVGTSTLPTGFNTSSQSLTKTLMERTDDAIQVKFGGAAAVGTTHYSYGGLAFTAAQSASATEWLLMSFDAELVSSNVDGVVLALGAREVNSPNTIRNEGWLGTLSVGGKRRFVRAIDPNDAAGPYAAHLVVYSIGVPPASPDVRVRLSNIVIQTLPESAVLTAAPVTGSILQAGEYSRTATVASDVLYDAGVAGEAIVVVETVAAGLLVKRATLAATGNSLAALLPDFTVRPARIIVVSPSDWREGDLAMLDPEPPQAARSRLAGSTEQFLDAAKMHRATSMIPTTGSAYRRGGYRSMVADRPYQFQTYPGRANASTARVRPGDRSIADVLAGNLNERAENHHTFALVYDTPIWLSMWVRISGADVPAAGFAILAQFRYTNDPGDGSTLSPECGLVLRSDRRLGVFARSDGGTPVLVGNGQPAGITTAEPLAGWHTYEPDRWHRILLSVTFSREGGGHVAYWLDGVKVFDQATPVGYDRAEGPQFHWGIYRSAAPGEQRADFQHVEWGTADLSSRAAAPLPI